jgi:hypothetical protein
LRRKRPARQKLLRQPIAPGPLAEHSVTRARHFSAAGSVAAKTQKNPLVSHGNSGEYPIEACLNALKPVKKRHFGAKALTPGAERVVINH